MDYPIVLKFKNQMVLIVGGGKVAYRKAYKISGCDVDLTIYSPSFIPDFDKLDVTKIKEKLTSERFDILEKFDLIYAATDDKKLNRAILDHCTYKRILVNSATDPLSDFIVPASFKSGDLSFSVSTSGKAPFLSKHIKEEIKAKYTEEYLELVFKIREWLKQSNHKKEMYELLKLNEEELRVYYEENCCRG